MLWVDGAARRHDPTEVIDVSVPPPDPGSGDQSGRYEPTDPVPHRSGLSTEIRGWGVAAHLSAFVGAWVALAFLGPLVVWLIGRDRHLSVDHHAKEALNFNLTFLLILVVGSIVAFVGAVATFGFGLIVIVPVAIVLGIVWIVLPIIGAVKAWDGEGYRYPLTIRFIS